jgi:hypothetical protein
VWKTGLLAAAVVALGAPTPSYAQTELLSLGQFRDSFSQRNISGGILTGIRRGKPSGNFDLEAIEVALPSSKFAYLCVAIASQAGGYNALAQYPVKGVAKGAKRLQVRTEYRERLAETQMAADIALRAVLTDECNNDPDGVIVPLRLKNSADPDQIDIFVNAGSSRPRIELVTMEGQQVDVATQCERTTAVSRIYNYRCILKPATGGPPATKLIVHLRGDGQSTSKPYAYAVQLDP